jgi:hypothetical protein
MAFCTLPLKEDHCVFLVDILNFDVGYILSVKFNKIKERISHQQGRSIHIYHI